MQTTGPSALWASRPGSSPHGDQRPPETMTAAALEHLRRSDAKTASAIDALGPLQTKANSKAKTENNGWS
ncbi:MAG: hypothetical protein RR340_07530 [Cloacibacillus sp.]